MHIRQNYNQTKQSEQQKKRMILQTKTKKKNFSINPKRQKANSDVRKKKQFITADDINTISHLDSIIDSKIKTHLQSFQTPQHTSQPDKLIENINLLTSNLAKQQRDNINLLTSNLEKQQKDNFQQQSHIRNINNKLNSIIANVQHSPNKQNKADKQCSYCKHIHKLDDHGNLLRNTQQKPNPVSYTGHIVTECTKIQQDPRFLKHHSWCGFCLSFNHKFSQCPRKLQKNAQRLR